MNNGVIVWLIIFGISAACFFFIAAVVAVKGLGDLRILLRHSRHIREIGSTDGRDF